MKKLAYLLTLLTALTANAAPILLGDVDKDVSLYDSTDPFAIGVSTAAYILGTNNADRLNTIIGCSVTSVNGATGAVTVTAASIGAVSTNDARLTDARVPLAHVQDWSTVTNKPTLFSGTDVTKLYATNGLSFVSVDGTNVEVWQIVDTQSIIIEGSGTTNYNGRYYATGVSGVGEITYTNLSGYILQGPANFGLYNIANEIGYNGFGPEPYTWYEVGSSGVLPLPTSYFAPRETNYITRLASTSEIPSFVAAYLASTAGYATLTNAAQDRITKWWVTDGERENWTPAQEFDDHVTPLITPNPHPMYVKNNSGVATNLSVISSLSLLGYQWTWNADKLTYDVAMPNAVSYQMGQELYVVARNQTGSPIANGKVVCSAGSVGDHTSIRLASRSDPDCRNGLIGMVTVDAGIAHGADGQVTTFGEVNDLNTSNFAVSNALWLAEGGDITNVEPATVEGTSKIYIGIVLRSHVTDGRILFKPHAYQTAVDVGLSGAVTNGATGVTLGATHFTGEATGPDATSTNGYVTLLQLQESASIYKTWQFWSGSNSTILADAKAMRTIDEGDAPYAVWTNSFSANTNGAYITYCSLPAGLTTLKAGLYTIHANIWQSGAALDAVSLGAEIYTLATNGVQTELTAISGTPAQVITADQLEYVFSLNIPSNHPMAVTDSVLVKFKTSAMAGAPMTVYINGGFLSAPVPSTQYALKSETGWLNGTLNGTNGTYHTSGTNVYWILTPAN